MRERLRRRIERVQNEFGLLDHTVILERIPFLAVREEIADGKFRLFRERIIGIKLSAKLVAAKIINIVHTKDEPSLQDLRHEFCHFAHPDWKEERVVAATSRPSKTRTSNFELL